MARIMKTVLMDHVPSEAEIPLDGLVFFKHEVIVPREKHLAWKLHWEIVQDDDAYFRKAYFTGCGIKNIQQAIWNQGSQSVAELLRPDTGPGWQIITAGTTHLILGHIFTEPVAPTGLVTESNNNTHPGVPWNTAHLKWSDDTTNGDDGTWTVDQDVRIHINNSNEQTDPFFCMFPPKTKMGVGMAIKDASGAAYYNVNNQDLIVSKFHKNVHRHVKILSDDQAKNAYSGDSTLAVVLSPSTGNGNPTLHLYHADTNTWEDL